MPECNGCGAKIHIGEECTCDPTEELQTDISNLDFRLSDIESTIEFMKKYIDQLQHDVRLLENRIAELE